VKTQRSSHVGPLDPLSPSPTRPVPRKSLPWLNERPAKSAPASVDLKVNVPSSLEVNIEPSFPSTSLCRYIEAELPIINSSSYQVIEEKSPVAPTSVSRQMSEVEPPIEDIPQTQDLPKAIPEPTKRAPLVTQPHASWSRRYMREKEQTALPPIPTSTLDDPTEKAIFRGLHVATAAAYDDEVDQWIQGVTGYGIREFLGGLGTLRGLGDGDS